MVGKLFSFLWRNAPHELRLPVVVLAFLTGLSRDGLLIVTNAAASRVAEPGFFALWLPIFGVTLVAYAALHLIYPVTAQTLVARMAAALRLRLTGRLLQTTPLFVQRREHGSLYHVMTTDVQVVTQIGRTLLEMLPAIVFLAIALPQIVVLSPPVAAFTVLVMAGGVLGYYLQRRAISGLARRIRALEIRYFERVNDVIAGFRELKLHRPRRRDLSEEVETIVGEARDTRIRMERRYALGEVVVHTLKFVLVGGVVFLLPLLGRADGTVVFQLLTVILFSLGPFEAVVSEIPGILRAMVSFTRIDELDADLAAAATPEDEDRPAPGPFHTLTLEGVTARWSTDADHGFELGPIDFELRRGEIVLVVGDNGSGKTTFLSVLTGLLDIDAGRVLVDGRPVEDRDRAAHRDRFSAIFTVFHLFYRLFGLSRVDPDHARALLRRLQLDEVTDYVDGAFTRLDLSSGQRRRLALAVVLLENRDVVVLDEFVADQDPGKRDLFFRSLLPELKAAGKTVVVTTHDLAWVPFCDRLVRFSGGRIVSIETPGAGPDDETVRRP
ncbi:MAG: ATP-binding cassette domain-containing protein [Phyllobacteriaceae bacterium]|nr:ATP-binding cassette domain-containing protein [Phyllobacteriaceae bacterium]